MKNKKTTKKKFQNLRGVLATIAHRRKLGVISPALEGEIQAWLGHVALALKQA